MIDFGGHLLNHISVDNAFVKFGQLELEYQDVKQSWRESKYGEAGQKAADGLIDFAEYEIPNHKAHNHFWPWSLL